MGEDKGQGREEEKRNRDAVPEREKERWYVLRKKRQKHFWPPSLRARLLFLRFSIFLSFGSTTVDSCHFPGLILKETERDAFRTEEDGNRRRMNGEDGSSDGAKERGKSEGDV